MPRSDTTGEVWPRRSPLWSLVKPTDTFPINGTDQRSSSTSRTPKQTSVYYRAGIRLLEPVAYRGPETGVRDRASYVPRKQDKVRLVFTTPLRPTGPIAAHVAKYGDGVRDLALWVDDARQAFERPVERGASPVQEPTVLHDEHGECSADRG